MANKPYHGAAHRRLGTPVVLAAEANPDYRCPRCGLTKAEGIKAYGKAGAKWVRGHRVRAQQATSPSDYQAEHARCSAGEGGEIAARIRNGKSKSAFDW